MFKNKSSFVLPLCEIVLRLVIAGYPRGRGRSKYQGITHNTVYCADM